MVKTPIQHFLAFLKTYFFFIAGSIVFALILRFWVIEAYFIPTNAMSPALIAGDYIFVNKIVYKKLPWRREVIARPGDVIVFQLPHDKSKDYIKRVIAVPTQTVEIKENQVWVNQQVITNGNTETLGKHTYEVVWGELENMPSVIVPPDHLFVMGDSRHEGKDSRKLGFIPMDWVVGRAEWIWLSREPSSPSLKIRSERVFNSIP